MENNKDKNLMKPTPEWMREYYDKFNQDLFNGELGDCDFELFTSGRGSQGKTLGLFKLRNPYLYVQRNNGALYAETYRGKEYIDKNNFVDLCGPCIMLNGHYSGTEEALQNTLVHEMVHYYDYMYGSCPKQAHGPRFREIASIISYRSGGRFTIQRLASAETMANYKLDDEIRARREKRIANKKARAMAIFVYKKDGKVELTIVSNTNERVPQEIYNYYTQRGGKGKSEEIITSSDPDLIDVLYNSGKRKLMRTWRYWNVENAPWISDVKNYNYDYLLRPGEIKENIKNKVSIMEENKGIRVIIEDVINKYVDGIENNDIRIGDKDLALRSPLENLE